MVILNLQKAQVLPIKIFFPCTNSLNPAPVLLFQLFSRKGNFTTILEGRISSFLLKLSIFNSYFNIQFQFIGVYLFLGSIWSWFRAPGFISFSSPAVIFYYLSFITCYLLLSAILQCHSPLISDNSESLDFAHNLLLLFLHGVTPPALFWEYLSQIKPAGKSK